MCVFAHIVRACACLCVHVSARACVCFVHCLCDGSGTADGLVHADSVMQLLCASSLLGCDVARRAATCVAKYAHPDQHHAAGTLHVAIATKINGAH